MEMIVPAFPLTIIENNEEKVFPIKRAYEKFKIRLKFHLKSSKLIDSSMNELVDNGNRYDEMIFNDFNGTILNSLEVITNGKNENLKHIHEQTNKH
ncbi:CLUMA_CG016609, isoform A [Clunio marinus]|uniref:CLUMA_CG016609, isoform A n=1 Tax=Clunio marinus TaxID=568069 RepID=A0A1J1ISW3_9DIPT|nr:CLUMA_CG016609, isoform A [Clunio marinus]